MSCRSSRSQMFLKIDVHLNFGTLTRKHLCWSLFLTKFSRTSSFTEHILWLLLWFLQQNNLVAFPTWVQSGVSHSYTVHLIVSLSKIDFSICQEENSLLPQKCSWNYFQFIKIHVKFIILIKTSAIQGGL